GGPLGRQAGAWRPRAAVVVAAAAACRQQGGRLMFADHAPPRTVGGSADAGHAVDARCRGASYIGDSRIPWGVLMPRNSVANSRPRLVSLARASACAILVTLAAVGLPGAGIGQTGDAAKAKTEAKADVPKP